MHRTLSAALLSILALSSVLFVASAPPGAEARSNRGFSVKDVRGDYSVSFHGEITEGQVVGNAVAAGTAHSDGKGNLKIARTLNINGSLILEQSGECSYSVNPDGSGEASCTFETPGLPDIQETYALAVVDDKEVDYISTTPGTAVLGIGKKQKHGSAD